MNFTDKFETMMAWQQFISRWKINRNYKDLLNKSPHQKIVNFLIGLSSVQGLTWCNIKKSTLPSCNHTYFFLLTCLKSKLLFHDGGLACIFYLSYLRNGYTVKSRRLNREFNIAQERIGPGKFSRFSHSSSSIFQVSVDH